jgi:hypothetical protein
MFKSIKSPRVRSASVLIGKIALINAGLLAINLIAARLAGWSMEELGNLLFLCGVLLVGLGASRLVTRRDRPTSPEAMLSATTEESDLREILRQSRRKDASDLSFFLLMGSAGLVCILISAFFFNKNACRGDRRENFKIFSSRVAQWARIFAIS